MRLVGEATESPAKSDIVRETKKTITTAVVGALLVLALGGVALVYPPMAKLTADVYTRFGLMIDESKNDYEYERTIANAKVDLQGGEPTVARQVVDNLRTVVRQNPTKANGHKLLARAMFDAGMNEEAIDEYVLLLSMEQRRHYDPTTLKDLATVLLKEGRCKEAAKTSDQALKALENVQAPMEGKPYSQLTADEEAEVHNVAGIAFLCLDDEHSQTISTDRDNSIRHFEQALKLRPDYVDPMIRLGILLPDRRPDLWETAARKGRDVRCRAVQRRSACPEPVQRCCARIAAVPAGLDLDRCRYDQLELAAPAERHLHDRQRRPVFAMTRVGQRLDRLVVQQDARHRTTPPQTRDQQRTTTRHPRQRQDAKPLPRPRHGE